MDHRAFDDLARFAANTLDRRRLLWMVAALPLAKSAPPAAAQTTCAEGQALCGGVCVDTCCDNANCGACGNVCTGGLTCFEGVCDCPSGLCVPNTGTGSASDPRGAWPVLALASAAAGVAAVWQRRRESTDPDHQPH